jgi:hypothetical protein
MSRNRRRHPPRRYDTHEDQCANELAHEFIHKKNVTIAFGGTKIVGGVDTGEPCVVVGVVRKERKDRIGRKDAIPASVGGLRTDVIEFPRMYSRSTCTGESGLACFPHDQKYRPIIGGISAINEGSTACTVGLVVRDSVDRRLVAITNNHCAGLLYDTAYAVPDYGLPDVAGLNMLQPSPYDGGTLEEDVYGQVKRAVPIRFGLTYGSENLVDCAISSLGVDDAWYEILDVENTVHGVAGSGPFPFANKDYYEAMEPVYKSGRTTGYTPPPATLVMSKDVAVPVYYNGTDTDNNKAAFTNLIWYQAATRFSNGGDSGSAILILKNGRYRVIGLHFAGSSDGTNGLACPIESVASELQVEAWDGRVTVPGDPRETITVNGVSYNLVGYGNDPVTHTPDA